MIEIKIANWYTLVGFVYKKREGITLYILGGWDLRTSPCNINPKILDVLTLEANSSTWAMWWLIPKFEPTDGNKNSSKL